jgi:hypothetical protein
MPLNGIPLSVLFLCSLCFLMLNAFGHNQVARGVCVGEGWRGLVASSTRWELARAGSWHRDGAGTRSRGRLRYAGKAFRRAELILSPFTLFPHVKCFCFWAGGYTTAEV